MFKFDRDAYNRRMEWFVNARFGMFIHWGLYAIPARGEWVRNFEEMTKEEYNKFFLQFNPQKCDMREWAKAARNAGMKYIVLTAKHHDGFCLWDTDTTDFKSTNTPAGRDFIREFTDACRAEDLRVGLYYSLLDWYHPDYPHYGDPKHPMRNNPEYSNENRKFSRYIEYMHKQVEELCTRYGKLDILWFDFSYDDMRNETWGATKLMEMVRRHQPDVVIDNRLEASGEGFGSLAAGNPTPYHGDFVSPEQIIPPQGIRDVNGNPLIWEACVTMNNNWGYAANDKYFKPADMLIKKLVECVSKGGNLLLNVGPDANGRIPRQSLDVLNTIGEWMKVNGRSIYGCTMAEIDKPDYGRITRDTATNTLYYHLFENTIGAVPLYGIREENVASIRRLCDGSEVRISRHWNHVDYPDLVFANLGFNPILPDSTDTVLEVRMK